jgi:hypothetical protein
VVARRQQDSRWRRNVDTPDTGWTAVDAPLPMPAHYVEISFDAAASTTYQIWLRLRGAADSKWNESVWVQFDQAVDGAGSPLWGIGTSSGLLVNLENCTGCGIAGWGWQDNGWWTGQTARVRFAVGGRQTLRVQVREDGVSFDQIVLSPVTWLSKAPGALRNDTTIVPKPSTTPTVTVVRQPYLQQVTPSSAIVVWATREAGRIALEAVGLDGAIFMPPGSIDARRPSPRPIVAPRGAAGNNRGGALRRGRCRHRVVDTTAGNSGGSLRATDVDIQPTSDAGAGYNVGWLKPGEWLVYSVDVTKAGSFSLSARVASNGPGGTFHVEADGVTLTGPMTIPNTGGHQKWTTIVKSGVFTARGAAAPARDVRRERVDQRLCNLNYVRIE